MQETQGLDAPTRIIASDRRLTMHLMGLWQGLRNGADDFVYAEAYIAAMPDDFWVDCCLILPSPDGDSEFYRIGENLARRSGIMGATAKFSDLIPGSLLAVAMRDHALAFARGAAILDEGEAHDAEGRTVLFRSIMMPLAGDDGRVSRLLAGARCRIRVEDA